MVHNDEHHTLQQRHDSHHDDGPVIQYDAVRNQEDVARRLDVQRSRIDSRGIYGPAQMRDLRQFVNKAEDRGHPPECFGVRKHALKGSN